MGTFPLSYIAEGGKVHVQIRLSTRGYRHRRYPFRSLCADISRVHYYYLCGAFVRSLHNLIGYFGVKIELLTFKQSGEVLHVFR